MNLNYIRNKLTKYVYFIEVCLAIVIILAIVISTIDLARYLYLIFKTDALSTYEIFQKFLGHVLLLVVGVELVIMLLSHTTSSVLEVVLYAIARKMLIHSDKMLDYLLGVIAIGAIFAIRRYLFTKEIKIQGNGTVFSAATAIADANTITGLKIPESLGNTIGGVITKLAEDTDRCVYEGIEFRVADAKLKVLTIKENLIEKVLIEELYE